MNIKGKVKRLSEVKVISDEFKKRDLVIKTDGEYPQILQFQLSKERCSLDLKEGQEVNVHFNLRGREWTNKNNEVMVFNTLDAWKIEFEKEESNNTQNEGDDLPF